MTTTSLPFPSGGKDEEPLFKRIFVFTWINLIVSSSRMNIDFPELLFINFALNMNPDLVLWSAWIMSKLFKLESFFASSYAPFVASVVEFFDWFRFPQESIVLCLYLIIMAPLLAFEGREAIELEFFWPPPVLGLTLRPHSDSYSPLCHFCCSILEQPISYLLGHLSPFAYSSFFTPR